MCVTPPASPADALAQKQARERRDARVRGVTSIAEMRDAIRRSARELPAISTVPRIAVPDAAAFRARAALGLPFLVTGLVNRWPLSKLTPRAMPLALNGDPALRHSAQQEALVPAVYCDVQFHTS